MKHNYCLFSSVAGAQEYFFKYVPKEWAQETSVERWELETCLITTYYLRIYTRAAAFDTEKNEIYLVPAWEADKDRRLSNLPL